ncbi:MAG: hypothetical protein CTY29_05395 [Methylobacter sp.]|nr:MAG: hypothetical protein CTY29_05395 [Methylobacter sp.]PPD17241.1 MAG: hypothetical protein CTY24_15275 [Methylobacter sp.]PPD36417.1 MAG: hypothetical protein CTY18_04755 [Methylomonas sp.]
MAINPETVEQIQALLTASATPSERIANLRQSVAGLSITRCDASDMDAEVAWLEAADLNVYLIDTSEHCVRITNAPLNATGLIIAVK